MKITIDTKEDSHEEIKRAIQLLSHLVGESVVPNSSNVFESSDSSVSGGMMGMFDSGDASTASNEDAPSLNAVFGSSEKKEVKDEKAEVEFY
jgi:hypothetical protein